MSKWDFINRLKFFLKWKFLEPARTFLFFFLGHKPNSENWGNRILVINLHALGDVVAMTSVLRRYKADFPGKKVFCLFAEDLGVSRDFFGEFADQVLFVDLKKFGLNLAYEFNLINDLRDIGFENVINQGYGIFEIPGKIIAVNVGAKNIIGYEGIVTELSSSNRGAKGKISFVKKCIFPRYTKVVPTIDRDFKEKGRVASFPRIYAAIYQSFLGREPQIMPTKIGTNLDAEKYIQSILDRHHISLDQYAVFAMGGRTPVRWWPVARFAEVAKEINRSRIPILLVGTRSEKRLSQELKKSSGVDVIDLIGELSVEELASIINHCLLVITNDTAPVHLAIALKKPSICIMGPAILGVSDHYGYPGINRWVWEETDCMFDYWECAKKAKPGEAAPCLMAVTAQKVINETQKLIALTKEKNLSELTKDSNFEAEFSINS